MDVFSASKRYNFFLSNCSLYMPDKKGKFWLIKTCSKSGISKSQIGFYAVIIEVNKKKLFDRQINKNILTIKKKKFFFNVFDISSGGNRSRKIKKGDERA